MAGKPHNFILVSSLLLSLNNWTKNEKERKLGTCGREACPTAHHLIILESLLSCCL